MPNIRAGLPFASWSMVEVLAAGAWERNSSLEIRRQFLFLCYLSMTFKSTIFLAISLLAFPVAGLGVLTADGQGSVGVSFARDLLARALLARQAAQVPAQCEGICNPVNQVITDVSCISLRPSSLQQASWLGLSTSPMLPSDICHELCGLLYMRWSGHRHG